MHVLRLITDSLLLVIHWAVDLNSGTIASSRWHALWVILVFSARKNLLSPTWLAFTQFKPCWHICPCKKMFVSHWPLFLHNNSQPLTCLILTDWLQQIFSTAGFPRVVGESGPISSCSRAPPCLKVWIPLWIPLPHARALSWARPNLVSSHCSG